MKEHDYTEQQWGHSFVWDQVLDGGKQLKGYGFGSVRNGDYLILADPKDRARTFRYQVADILRPGNPPDMFFATINFAPRGQS
jgi:hypothetical protein